MLAALVLTRSLAATDGDLAPSFGASSTGYHVTVLSGFPSGPGDFAVDGQSRLVTAVTVDDIDVQDSFVAPNDQSLRHARFAMQAIFGDDFESQNLCVWSAVVTIP